jgi:hypothetical protein
MPAWRARERFLDMLNGDEGASFNLIPAWIDKVEGLDDTTTPFFFVEMADSGRFEAIFVMLGPIRATLNTLRPFYALMEHILDHDITLPFLLPLGSMQRIVSSL